MIELVAQPFLVNEEYCFCRVTGASNAIFTDVVADLPSLPVFPIGIGVMEINFDSSFAFAAQVFVDPRQHLPGVGCPIGPL